jgi:hypothetical protein
MEICQPACHLPGIGTHVALREAAPTPGDLVSEQPAERELKEELVIAFRCVAGAEAGHDVRPGEALEDATVAMQLHCGPGRAH